jgi:hypothetical protein
MEDDFVTGKRSVHGRTSGLEMLAEKIKGESRLRLTPTSAIIKNSTDKSKRKRPPKGKRSDE